MRAIALSVRPWRVFESTTFHNQRLCIIGQCRPWASLQTRAARCRLPAVQLKITLKGSILSRDEVQALLAAPDKATWCGRLNWIKLTLLYNTDARVSEMIGIRVRVESAILEKHDDTIFAFVPKAHKIRSFEIFHTLKQTSWTCNQVRASRCLLHPCLRIFSKEKNIDEYFSP